jgi:diguanylate cyclase (GGDEF)-like protein/PAS domain S-box-containing protein
MAVTTPVLHILLVEDNAGDARLVRELLKQVRIFPGGGAATAAPGFTHVVRLQQAVEVLQARGSDVILLDLSLPDAEGIQGVTRLHAVAPLVPIVVLSARDDDALALAGVEAGAQDYLVKGRLDGNALARALRYAIVRKRDEQRGRILFDKSPIGTCIVDEQGLYEVVNPAYAAMVGFSQEELVGRHSAMILAEHARDAYITYEHAHLLDGQETTEDYEALTKQGQPWIIRSTALTLTGEDGRPRRASYIANVTEQRLHEQHLTYAAHHDALTGLPNRVLFADRLEQAMRDAKRQSTSLAVVQIDLNHFKEINDTNGHAAGDIVLHAVAGRMGAEIRASDTVARLGGDEFAVLLPDITEAGALHVANKMRAAVCLPINLSDRKVVVDMSMGIALYPEHSEALGALINDADLAMYIAKAAGGGVVMYAPDQDELGPDLPALAVDLHQAAVAGQLRLHYQPVFHDGAALPRRVEALVRWQHPTRGLLLPISFIMLAEQTDALEGLTVWVLEEALRQCRAWQEEGITLDISVNLALQTLRDRQFPDLVEALLRRYEIAPGRLTLEITERSLTTRAADVLTVLNRLVNLGVRLSLDDFGIGYSSLASLRYVHLHELKIDYSFIRQAGTEQGALLVSFVLGMGVMLGLDLVVEGVETPETLKWLRSLGRLRVQGNLLCPPSPAAEVASWVRAHP